MSFVNLRLYLTAMSPHPTSRHEGGGKGPRAVLVVRALTMGVSSQACSHCISQSGGQFSIAVPSPAKRFSIVGLSVLSTVVCDLLRQLLREDPAHSNSKLLWFEHVDPSFPDPSLWELLVYVCITRQGTGRGGRYSMPGSVPPTCSGRMVVVLIDAGRRSASPC